MIFIEKAENIYALIDKDCVVFQVFPKANKAGSGYVGLYICLKVDEKVKVNLETVLYVSYEEI